MTSISPPNPGPDSERLALACLAHMEQEEAMLGESLESLRQVRAALAEGDLSSLAAALDRQGHAVRAADELRRRRAELRQSLARAFRLPLASVTLHTLATVFPGDAADRLRRCRERLMAMAGEVDRLNRGNALLVRQFLDFLQRFFVAITGGSQTGGCYNTAGKLEQAECGSMIEMRG